MKTRNRRTLWYGAALIALLLVVLAAFYTGTFRSAYSWISATLAGVSTHTLLAAVDPSLSIKADGSSGTLHIPYGSTATISWDATNEAADSCFITQNSPDPTSSSTSLTNAGFGDNGSLTAGPLNQFGLWVFKFLCSGSATSFGGGAGGGSGTDWQAVSGTHGSGGGGGGYNSAAANAANGGNGVEWDGAHGAGGGGGGGGSSLSTTGNRGGNGGLYGGGGGGTGHHSSTAGGNGAPGILVITYTPGGGSLQRIYLTTANSSWTVPSNWNSANNTVEAIGAGGGGANSSTGTGPYSNGGGGGGGYSASANVSLAPNSVVVVHVGSGGLGQDNAGGLDGTDTYLCNSLSDCASMADSAVVLAAEGGKGSNTPYGSNGGAGGLASNGIGMLTYSGGYGGASAVSCASAGGGGAAGPGGDGAFGGAGSTIDFYGEDCRKDTGGGGGAAGAGWDHFGIPGDRGLIGGVGGAAVDGTPGGRGGSSPNSGVGGSNGGGGGGGIGVILPGENGGTGALGGTGIEWDFAHGSGGGGGGGGASDTGLGGRGGAGGLYGGGGAAGGAHSSQSTFEAVADSFTGADDTGLTAHTPETGGVWTYNCCGDSTIMGNKIEGPAWAISVMYNHISPLTADYEVSADVIWNGENVDGMQYAGVVGRVVENSERYAAYYHAADQQWKLEARHEGDVSDYIIGTFDQPYVQGQTHNIKLKMEGTSITAYLDGVLIISATDSTVTAAGDPGVIIGAIWGPEQMLVDNFLVMQSTGGSSGGMSGGDGAKGVIVITYAGADDGCDFGDDIGAGECRGFLTSGTSFTIPSDWNNADNSIEAIGGGGGGTSGTPGFTTGGGGGGGAYAKIKNVSLTPDTVRTIRIGAGGTGAPSLSAGGRTYFGASTCAAALVCARGGNIPSGSVGGKGGLASLSIGQITYAGGNGGSQLAGWSGAGGGGAGGPNGPGANGGTDAANNNPLDGGGGGGGGGGGIAGSPGMLNQGGSGGNPFVQSNSTLDSVNVKVSAPPSTVDPLTLSVVTTSGSTPVTRVRKGSTVSLGWNVTGLFNGDSDTSCTLSANPSSAVPTQSWDHVGSTFASSSMLVTILQPTVFTMTCQNDDWVPTTRSMSITVSLIPSFQEI